MTLEFNAKAKTEGTQGIIFKKIIKLIAPKGRMHVETRKNGFNIMVSDFPRDALDEIFTILEENFEIISMDLNANPKFKIRNDEKELKIKKDRLQQDIAKKNTIVAKIKKYIFESKVFSLREIREAFPDVNFGTIRAYVNDMKMENLIVEIERGKYALR